MNRSRTVSAGATAAGLALLVAGCGVIGQGERPPDGRSAAGHRCDPSVSTAYCTGAAWVKAFNASMAAYSKTFRAAAAAYLKAHPVPARPGMTAGIVLDSADVPGFPGQAAYLADDHRYQMWEQMWAETLLTADGKTVTISCGDMTQHLACRRPMPGICKACTGPGGPGTYEYVPVNGDVRRPGRVIVIMAAAVSIP
jgi:hypothetical protein